MAFKTNGQENSNFQNFLHDDMNNPDTFLNQGHPYLYIAYHEVVSAKMSRLEALRAKVA